MASAETETSGRRGAIAQLRYARPKGSTELVLVRHGESEPTDPTSPFPLVMGRGDPALAPTGIDQAEALADRLAHWPIDAIYITPLRRTAATAAPIAARLGIIPIVEPDLIEVHMGAWEGGRYRERITAGDPLAARVLDEGRFDLVDGGESNQAILERAGAAVARIAAAHPDQLVVAITHVVVISNLLARALGAPPFGFVLGDNTGISRLVVDGDRWTVRTFNDLAHLE